MSVKRRKIGAAHLTTVDLWADWFQAQATTLWSSEQKHQRDADLWAHAPHQAVRELMQQCIPGFTEDIRVVTAIDAIRKTNPDVARQLEDELFYYVSHLTAVDQSHPKLELNVLAGIICVGNVGTFGMFLRLPISTQTALRRAMPLLFPAERLTRHGIVHAEVPEPQIRGVALRILQHTVKIKERESARSWLLQRRMNWNRMTQSVKTSAANRLVYDPPIPTGDVAAQTKDMVTTLVNRIVGKLRKHQRSADPLQKQRTDIAAAIEAATDMYGKPTKDGEQLTYRFTDASVGRQGSQILAGVAQQMMEECNNLLRDIPAVCSPLRTCVEHACTAFKAEVNAYTNKYATHQLEEESLLPSVSAWIKGLEGSAAAIDALNWVLYHMPLASECLAVEQMISAITDIPQDVPVESQVTSKKLQDYVQELRREARPQRIDVHVEELQGMFHVFDEWTWDLSPLPQQVDDSRMDSDIWHKRLPAGQLETVARAVPDILTGAHAPVATLADLMTLVTSQTFV